MYLSASPPQSRRRKTADVNSAALRGGEAKYYSSPGGMQLPAHAHEQHTAGLRQVQPCCSPPASPPPRLGSPGSCAPRSTRTSPAAAGRAPAAPQRPSAAGSTAAPLPEPLCCLTAPGPVGTWPRASHRAWERCASPIHVTISCSAVFSLHGVGSSVFLELCLWSSVFLAIRK